MRSKNQKTQGKKKQEKKIIQIFLLMGKNTQADAAAAAAC